MPQKAQSPETNSAESPAKVIMPKLEAIKKAAEKASAAVQNALESRNGK